MIGVESIPLPDPSHICSLGLTGRGLDARLRNMAEI